MDIRKIFEVFNYQISEGSEYQWKCYGPNARFLDFDNDFACASIILDSQNQTIYQAEVWIKDSEDSPYRYINPDFAEKHKQESIARGVDIKIAFDNVKFVDLEIPEDFYEKAEAIWNNRSFDKRVQVPIEDDLFLDLAIEAHKQDITVNVLVEKILLEVIENEKNHSRAVIV